MQETGYASQQTTTTVTSSTTVQTNIRFDPLYLRTIPGILKIVQVLSALLGFISVRFSRYSASSDSSYFSWITMIAFWFTLILLGLYLFHIVEKFYKIPWMKIEFLFCGVWTLLLIIGASIVVAKYDSPHKAAGFFGFVCALAYGIDCALKFRGVRAGALAQGSRVVSKQTTSTVAAPEREAY